MFNIYRWKVFASSCISRKVCVSSQQSLAAIPFGVNVHIIQSVSHLHNALWIVMKRG